MSYTTMTYRTKSGQWAWTIVDENRTVVAARSGYASEREAEADADAALAEGQQRESVDYWIARLNAYDDGHTLGMSTGLFWNVGKYGISVDELDAMIEGAKACKHANELRSEIAEWSDLLAAKLERLEPGAIEADSCDGIRADGEPLTGIEAIDYDPAIAHPGNGDHQQ